MKLIIREIEKHIDKKKEITMYKKHRAISVLPKGDCLFERSLNIKFGFIVEKIKAKYLYLAK